MPVENLHLTVLEITHSKTAPEITSLVGKTHPKVEQIVNYAYKSKTKRARLIKPTIGFDAAAIALSFVPAAGEALPDGREASLDDYTYHHLRRDVYNICEEAGVKVDSRYVVPSAHLTIGRFIDKGDFEVNEEVDGTKVEELVGVIENINAMLKREYWPNGAGIVSGGEFIVGSEKGLVLRRDTVWYGGGSSVMEGRGF
jgi:hypothetical protein